MNTESKGLAVITGASSGIGAIYADRLARRDYDLLLVARNRERMDDVAKKLAAETGRNVETVAADLNDSSDLARLEEILRNDDSITLLVNNAGSLSAASSRNAAFVNLRTGWGAVKAPSSNCSFAHSKRSELR
jgi:hypothetical protein